MDSQNHDKVKQPVEADALSAIEPTEGPLKFPVEALAWETVQAGDMVFLRCAGSVSDSALMLGGIYFDEAECLRHGQELASLLNEAIAARLAKN